MGFSQRIIEFDGFADGSFGFCRYFAGGTLIVDRANTVSIGQAGPRGSVVRLDLDRLLEVFETVNSVELKPQIASAQVGIVSLRIDVSRLAGGRSRDPYFFRDRL